MDDCRPGGAGHAYRKLRNEILPAVRRQVARRVAVAAGREDIVQNVPISGHRVRHTDGPDRPFVPWLRAVVRNASIEGSALAALPPGQRQAVELLHVEELSVAEAARRAGVTPGARKVRAHRGDRALRPLLAKGGR